MAMRKNDCIEFLMRLCFDEGFEKVALVFLEMSPMEGEDCMRAFWNKASVGSLRRFTEIMDNDDLPVDSEFYEESDIPDDYNDLEIHFDDDETIDEQIVGHDESEDDYFDL